MGQCAGDIGRQVDGREEEQHTEDSRDNAGIEQNAHRRKAVITVDLHDAVRPEDDGHHDDMRRAQKDTGLTEHST